GALKVPFLDLFDRMPTDSQMTSHMRHGHVLRQLQDVSLKPLRASAIRLGKPDLYLPSDPAGQAEHSLDGELDNRRSQTNGKGHEPAKHSPFLHDLPTPTSRTLKGTGVLTNSKDGPSFLETSVNMMHTPSCDPETVIDYARGHDFLVFSDFSNYPRRQKSCPFSLFNQGTLLREEPEICRSYHGTIANVAAWEKWRFDPHEL